MAIFKNLAIASALALFAASSLSPAQSAERHDDLQNDTVSVHNYTSH